MQIYTKTFGVIVREVERAKLKYDELEKTKKFNEASEKEKRKIIENQNRERQQKENKYQEFYTRRENLRNKAMREIITTEEYNAKVKELKEEFSDIFEKKEKTKNDFEVDISMTEFIDTLAIYMKDNLVEAEKNIYLRPRYKTFKDIKRRLLNDNKETLGGKKYQVYYYLYSSKTLFIPKDDFKFEKENNIYESYVCIIIDIYNDKGECFYDLLIKKEKEQELDPKIRLKKIEKEKEKEKEKNKIKEKGKEQQQIIKPKLTEEQKKALKEKERLEV